MKIIEITTTELSYSNPYVDFMYDGILYRWYTNEDKFSKLYHLPGDFSRAVRGNERKQVFEQLKDIVEQLKADRKATGIIDFAQAVKEKKEKEANSKKIEDMKKYLLDLIDGQSQETVIQISEAILSGNIEAYKAVTEPIIARKIIYEYNTGK